MATSSPAMPPIDFGSPPAPARDFWSVVAYEVGTNAFIHKPDDRVAVSSYDKASLTVNEDGSVDVYIGPAAPDGLANNWIPTAGKDFWLIMRFYGPDMPLFDGSWSIGPVRISPADNPTRPDLPSELADVRE